MNLKFRKNGLRFLDSIDGDFLLTDPVLKMQILFTRQFLEKAQNDFSKRELLGRKLLDFLSAHELERWRIARRYVEQNDIDCESLFEEFKIDNLRKIEKIINEHEQQNN